MRLVSFVTGFCAALALVLAITQPVIAQIDVAPRDGRRALGLNLAEVAGWSTELPFIDAMRNGRAGSGISRVNGAAWTRMRCLPPGRSMPMAG